jgi:hypothetical protein
LFARLDVGEKATRKLLEEKLRNCFAAHLAEKHGG